MDICFEGIGQTTATFQAEGEIRPGMVVTLAENGAAAPGGAGDARNKYPFFFSSRR